MLDRLGNMDGKSGGMKRVMVVMRWVAVLPLALLSALTVAWVIQLIDPPHLS